MTTSTTIKSKFKTGDKVKILSDRRIGTITRITNTYAPYFVIWDKTQGIAGGYFTESDIELYTEEKKASPELKFKVWERVKLSGEKYTGTIISIHEKSSTPYIVQWDNAPRYINTYLIESDIEPYTDEKSVKKFLVGDKVVISDDPRIGKDFCGRIGTIISTCGTDKRIVKVGELIPDIFHISHLRPYIESQPSNADSENEQQTAVNINRPNANLNNLTDNQTRITVAAAVMKGILCNTNIVKDCKDLDNGQEYVAKRAVAFTDALLEEINKKKD